jgi:PilZ domain
MDQNRDAVAEDSRRDPRVNMGEQVTITFATDSIIGPGQNISAQGVFFVAETSIPVTVRIDGVEATVRGELVRVQSMGEGRVGIAVRFLEPVPAPPA